MHPLSLAFVIAAISVHAAADKHASPVALLRADGGRTASASIAKPFSKASTEVVKHHADITAKGKSRRNALRTGATTRNVHKGVGAGHDAVEHLAAFKKSKDSDMIDKLAKELWENISVHKPNNAKSTIALPKSGTFQESQQRSLQAGEICACSPNTYEFTFDFSLTCPPVNITTGDAVAETSCLISPFGDPSITDLVPVSVQSIDILELNQNMQISAQENIEGNFANDDTFSYTSTTDQQGGSTDPTELPRGVQLNIVGVNRLDEPIINVYLIIFTNDCNSLPFEVGNSAGWTVFSDLSAPNPELCDVRDPDATGSPTPTIVPVAPTFAPTLSPTAVPSPQPTTKEPTPSPTISPVTPAPTDIPSSQPRPVTSAPTTKEPTPSPTTSPVTPAPTDIPSSQPRPVTSAPTTKEPTPSPTISPVTPAPTDIPSSQPRPVTNGPTSRPTTAPTERPSPIPATAEPTPDPSVSPTPREPVTPSPTEAMSMSMFFAIDDFIDIATEEEDIMEFGRRSKKGGNRRRRMSAKRKSKVLR